MRIRDILKKPVSVALCAALLVGGSAGVTAYAVSAARQDAPLAGEAEQPAGSKQETTLTNSKDETVYVLTGTDGSVQKIIVSDWVKNTLGEGSLRDESGLDNIQNVKGNESYTPGGDNTKVWDAAGKDIYYQGNIDKQLPVGLSVTYQLDGKSITAEELAGKSGKVTIRYTYTNRQYKTVEIDGRQEKIYVPFAMLTGLMLDNKVFSNVTVTNGKVVDDGSHTVVVGIAFPGMQSNLNLSSEKFEIPESVEITADVRNFRMTNTVTLATNEIFSRLDTSKLDGKVGDLKESLNTLTDAMQQLTDGSSKLYDGLNTLLEKSGELIAGINKLADGAASLKAGAGKLDSGVADLLSGAGQLSDGLGQLSGNSATLNAGAKQVFDSLLATANTQLAAAGLTVPALTVENYAGVLDGVITSLRDEALEEQVQAAALAKVTAAVNGQRDAITAAVTEAVRAQVQEKVLAAVRANVQTRVLATLGMTDEQYAAGVAAGVVTEEQQAQIRAAVDAQMQSNEVQETVRATTDAQMQSEEVQALIAANTDEQVSKLIASNLASAEVQAQIAAGLAQAKAGRESIVNLKAQLNSYNEFYTGLTQYTAGVDSAKDGADRLTAGAGQLKDGTAELKAGLDQLYSGILILKNGAPALTDGVTQLRDGAMSLSDGLKKFNEEGVQKLVDAVQGDLAGLLTRIRATADVSRDYNNFSGIADGMDGQVKFIYRTASIQAD